LALRGGKAHFKDVVASRVDLDIGSLPYDEAVLSLIEKARAAGRPVYLASASNEKFVAAVADQLGLFDGWFASDASSNLSAEVKARRLTEAFGRGGFDYVGNEKADLPVWAAAAGRIGIRTSPKLNGRLAALGVEVLDSPKADLRQWLKLIRVHQYAKNALVFLPLLTAHKFGLGSLFHAALAAVAFSLCASSVYILNDLVDLSADRDHPTKRSRPLASGAIPIANAVVVMGVMFLGWRLRPLSPGLSSAFSRSTMC
jgi:UbiA prenyltransferase family